MLFDAFKEQFKSIKTSKLPRFTETIESRFRSQEKQVNGWLTRMKKKHEQNRKINREVYSNACCCIFSA